MKSENNHSIVKPWHDFSYNVDFFFSHQSPQQNGTVSMTWHWAGALSHPCDSCVLPYHTVHPLCLLYEEAYLHVLHSPELLCALIFQMSFITCLCISQTNSCFPGSHANAFQTSLSDLQFKTSSSDGYQGSVNVTQPHIY